MLDFVEVAGGVRSRAVAVSGPVSEFRLPPSTLEQVDEPVGVDWIRVSVYVVAVLVSLGFWSGVAWLVWGGPG